MSRTIDAKKHVTVQEVQDFCHMMYGLDQAEVGVQGVEITVFTELTDVQWADFETFFVKTPEERETEEAEAQALLNKPITDGLKAGATMIEIQIMLGEIAKRLGVEVK